MVLTVRLEKKDEKRLGSYARTRDMNRTQAVKELLKKGFMVSQLQDYTNGRLSLGKLAEILDISMGEALSLTATYNAHPRMPRDYVTDALENAETIRSR